MDIGKSGSISSGLLARIDQAHNFLFLMGVEFDGTAQRAPRRSRVVESTFGAFA